MSAPHDAGTVTIDAERYFGRFYFDPTVRCATPRGHVFGDGGSNGIIHESWDGVVSPGETDFLEN